MKFPRPRVLVLLIALLGGSAGADELKPMAKAPDSEFGAVFACTIQYAHEDVWNYTDSATGVLVPTVSEVTRGQMFDALLSFGGCKGDAAGNANVTYDLRIKRPDGTERLVGHDLVARKGPAGDPRMVQHPEEMTRLAFQGEDPAGDYQITAIVTDHVARQTVTVGQTIKLLAGSGDQALPENFDLSAFEEWLSHYYLKPRPLQALPVLRWITKNETAFAKPGAWPPVLGAYEMILRDNPWLVPHFTDALASPFTSEKEKITLIYVLSYAFRNEEKFAARLPADQQDAFLKIRSQPWPDPDREIVDAGQLDTLWGRFFATGAQAPIKSLVEALNYHVFNRQFEEFKQLSPKPDKVPPEVYKAVLCQTALWSLKSNARQSALVRDYCGFMFKRFKGSDAEIQLFLGMIVGAKVRTSDGREIDLSQPLPKPDAVAAPK